MSDYQRYPLTLTHPHFRPSKSTPVPGTEIFNINHEIVGYRSYQGTPGFREPVVVVDEREEEYYKSEGYEPAGKIDPSAWVRAHTDAPPADYRPQKYPMERNGKYYATAADDPEATPEDLAELKQSLGPIAQLSEPAGSSGMIANMQATIDALQKQMLEMMAEKAKEDRPLAHRQKRRGRPPKVPRE